LPTSQSFDAFIQVLISMSNSQLSLVDRSFPVPLNETERLAALHQYAVLDSMPEQDYDDLTQIAAQICGTPISLISLVDTDRQWFKSRYGIDAMETPREQAFCSYAIITPEQVMVVPSAREDHRFANNPLVTSAPNIQFYAGAPLVNSDGFALGTLCVIDQVPRQMTIDQINALQALSRQVMTQLEIRAKAVQLEQEVKLREEAANLAIAKSQALEQALQQLQNTQASLVQSEKMSALGQLVAGIAHEINNPVSFIDGNLAFCRKYAFDLLQLVKLYQERSPEQSPQIAEAIKRMDLDYLATDFPNLLNSMENGAHRIKEIVRSLRTFSRLDETGVKAVDIHENLDAILTIIESQFHPTFQRPGIQVVRHYGQIPLLNCYIKDLNQVFIQVIYNAIDALELGADGEKPTVTIRTGIVGNRVRIAIADNGQGIPEETKARIFEPFYTTKPIGTGTGMGLAMSYQIVVEQHGGELFCISELGRGAEFVIEIPVERV
jgi:two-component system, NtrC family, sensor kinase